MRDAAALVGLAAVLVCGCGSKTGLTSPPPVPRDAGTVADAGTIYCVEAPRGVGPVRASFTLPVTLAAVDLFFLIDATASMRDEIDNVRARLRSLVVPGVREAIPDAFFGLGFVGEFPVPPHPSTIRPYELRVPITADVLTLQAALGRVPRWGNRDDPEAQVEGLYQVATGEGLGEWIGPSLGCLSGGRGGACFRPGAVSIIVLITDAPFHNGPDGANPYWTVPRPPLFPWVPHDYDETLRALRERGIFVIGLGARDMGAPSPMRHLRRVATDTGAVGADGAPMAFDIGSRGDRAGTGIVQAVRTVAEALPLDVEALVEDVRGDAVDARTLVTGVRAVSADPPSGAREVLPSRFAGVLPGTRLTFEIVVDPSALPVVRSTQRIPARMLFLAFGRSRLGAADFVIVVPGDDGAGCSAGVP